MCWPVYNMSTAVSNRKSRKSNRIISYYQYHGIFVSRRAVGRDRETHDSEFRASAEAAAARGGVVAGRCRAHKQNTHAFDTGRFVHT